jgi:hypothetical protein
MIVLFSFLISGMVMIINSNIKIEKNKKEFKNEYLIPRMREFFSEFEYNYDDSLQTSTIRSLKLIPIGDSIYTNELIKGRYRGCSFIQGNVLCTKTKEDMDGDESTTTVFKGRLIIIGLSVIKEGEIRITPENHTLYRIKGGKSLQYNHPVNENFDICGSDEIQLPKYFLDHIVTFSEVFNKYRFYYKIISDRIYIAIDHIENLYDVGSCKHASVGELDKIIKKDSAFFTNLISLIIDANKKE